MPRTRTPWKPARRSRRSTTEATTTKNIATLLIANRGEIAVRIVRAARELGIRTVLARSSADADSLAAQLADDTLEIGPPPAKKSYLNAAAVLEAARSCRADAIHPGYGFLSESPEFAAAVEDAGIIYVGPTAQTMRLMGDKSLARETAALAGVSTIPGTGVVANHEQAHEFGATLRFPLLVKAAAGGGGRGIRLAHDDSELDKQVDLSQSEAQAAFGDRRVYLERFYGRARHIEVQILGDGQNVVHLYDRDCSLQRRRQKLLEEAPAPTLPAAVRARLCDAAVRLGQSVAYRGVGTLEFLYDENTNEFFFMEMNTRIQVEHPITEAITGIDIVREMLFIAAGEGLRFGQDEITLRGAALECRINAEDPTRDFAPSPGTVTKLRLPGGPGIRIDTMLFAGYKVPPFYDSLLAKVIAWDETREGALRRMRGALSELQIEGIATTSGLHTELLKDPAVQTAAYDTTYLERWMAVNGK
jgi:acetyl-CoA carboxylase biotin carboxylase subunit